MVKREGAATESDAGLVERLVSGVDATAAFETLYERYGPVTYAFFRRRTGSAELAAEQNQELYLSVLRHVSGYRGASSFTTWLFTLARNQLSHLRRRLRVHTDEWAAEAPAALWDSLEDRGPRPAAEAERSERDRRLRRCIAELPEIERAVVVGQYYGERTLRELTEELRLSNKSGARALLIAAQRRLRRCVERAGIAPAAG